LSPGSTNTQLSIFTSQHGQLSSVLDLSESENAEESKGRGGVCQSARYETVLLRWCIFILLFLMTMSGYHVDAWPQAC